MSATEKLVPRFMAATVDGPREFYAYVIRDGLAIHHHPDGFALSATGCGKQLSVFDEMNCAEAALLELAPLARWSEADPGPVEVGELHGRIVAIIRRHGGTLRRRPAAETMQ